MYRWIRRPIILASLFAVVLWLTPQALAVDITITAANVVVVSGTPEVGTAGAAITAGQAVYRDATDNKIKLADSNATAPTADVVGIAVTGAANGQAVAFLSTGVINIGATLTQGETYILSANPGGVAPIADIVTGWRLTYIGYAISTSQMRLNIKSTQVVK